MRVLITGMSATGKSTLVRELRRRGYLAYDADDDGFTEPRPHGGWGWRVERVRELFDRYADDLLFFAGCSDEQRAFTFDVTLLLTVPEPEQLRRLRDRSTNAFGKTSDELQRVRRDLEQVEPLLRAAADVVLSTMSPVAVVADDVIAAVSRAHT